MKNMQYPLTILAAAFASTVACAAEPPTSTPKADSQSTTAVFVDTQDTAAPEKTKRAAKIDAEAAQRELEQMRQQMRDLSKRMAELSSKLGDVGPRAYAYRYLGDPERGMVGVVLGKDERGLRINAVTPGGPADKAGMKNGDVIVALNGTDVSKNVDARTPEPLRDLKVGQDIKVTVLRDGKKIDATMKAERREPFNFSFAFNDQDSGSLKKLEELKELGAELPPDFSKRMQEQAERVAREAERAAEHVAERAQRTQEQSIRIAERAQEQAQRSMLKINFAPWWGLNLANLNPDLGAYFGTDHGVLVLSADADASKTLKSGDVLIAISGKSVERPEDALRLLREQPGKDIKVEVLRQRKAQTLSMRAPEFKTMFMPLPPTPPAAPIAPVAPRPATPMPAPRASLPTPPTPPAPPSPHSEPAPPAAPSPATRDEDAPRTAPSSSKIA